MFYPGSYHAELDTIVETSLAHAAYCETDGLDEDVEKNTHDGSCLNGVATDRQIIRAAYLFRFEGKALRRLR